MQKEQEKHSVRNTVGQVVFGVVLIGMVVAFGIYQWNRPAAPPPKEAETSQLESYSAMERDADDSLQGKGTVKISASQAKAQKTYARLMLAENVETIIAEYDAITKDDPAYYRVSHMGMILDRLVSLGEQDLAVERWERMLRDSDGDPQVSWKYGAFLCDTARDDLRNPVRAEELMRKSMSETESSSLTFAYAIVLARIGEWDRAVETCDRSTECAIAEKDRQFVHMKAQEKRSGGRNAEFYARQFEAIEKSHARALERRKEYREMYLQKREPPLSTKF